MNILYIGPVNPGTTTLQRLNAFREFDVSLTVLNSSNNKQQMHENKFLNRVFRFLFRKGLNRFFWYQIGPKDYSDLNERILEVVDKNTFNVVWIDKGLIINKNIFERFNRNGIRIIGYSPDDMNGRHNQSFDFLQSLPFYDIFYTTKSYGVSELSLLGCKNAKFVGNAFDEKTHFPGEISVSNRKKYGGEVGFIGDYELERASSILFLANNGIKVRVWGTNWHKFKHKHSNLLIENIPLMGREYAIALSNFDINLCFLRKINRDLQTTRSVEIPASGGFMLAERTCEHLELFEEGKEAEFFTSNQELLEKVIFYLKNDSARVTIRNNGHLKSVENYGLHTKIKNIISDIDKLIE